MTSSIYDLTEYFPRRFRLLINTVLHSEGVEELRIRINRPINVIYASRDELHSKYVVTREECEYLCESFCQHSVYSCEEDMRSGFITLPSCGIRVGISGNITESGGSVVRFRNTTGFCIRIPHEHLYCSRDLCKATDGLHNDSVLIISEPGVGKTTLLRDMARELSDTYKRKVCIVDERSEIAGSGFGEPSFNVGIRTDVLDNCPKSEGLLMALRTLSPNVLITDELGKTSDFDCVKRAVTSGVSVAASIHSASVEDVQRLSSEISNAVRYMALLRIECGKRICLLHDMRKKNVSKISLKCGGD